MLVACTSRPENVVETEALPAIYPDYIGVTIPAGIAPLNFAMADDSVTTIDVTIKGKGSTTLQANGAYTDFDIEEWHQLLDENKGGTLTLSVCAEKDGRWTRYRDFTINVSQEPLGEWGITYRRIPPSYEIYSHMGLFQRNLSNFEETTLIENRELNGTCLNCHTANRTNPDQYVFHARGDHGATIIHRNGKEEYLKARRGALLLVSHDLHFVQEYADHVVLLEKSVLAQGRAEEVFASPEFEMVFGTGTAEEEAES